MGVLLGLSGFCHRYFRWAGIPILKVFKWLPGALEGANLLIHAEAYASVLSFFTIAFIGVGAAVTSVIYLATGSFNLLPMVILPVVALAIMAYQPLASASSRASSLGAEVPYAAAYITVMATGGISPLKSMERLQELELLPRISDAAKRMSFDMKVGGSDPVAALYRSAKTVPSKDYRDFVTGYASTLSSGGDVTHYLMLKTRDLFAARSMNIRGLGDRISMLMEAFITVTVLLTLGFYSIFVVSKVIKAQLPLFSESTFVLFGYVVIPLLSSMFVYLADVLQPRYPVTDWRAYKRSLIALPIVVITSLFFVLPFALPQLAGIFSPGVSVVKTIMQILGLRSGFELSTGLAITFLSPLLPLVFIHRHYATDSKSVFEGLIRFQRDLVEIRKTGLSPEKCILNLSERSYGGFSKHLRVISNQIAWGQPLPTIYQTLAKNVRSWLAQITAFLLIDAIDVGGGSPETLETLASFGENIEALEREKRMNLRPLMLIPYIGGIVLIISTLVLLSFMGGMANIVGLSFSEKAMVSLFVPPLFIQALLTGIVAGKVSDSKVSSGFLHAFILVLITLMSAILVPTLTKGFGLG